MSPIMRAKMQMSTQKIGLGSRILNYANKGANFAKLTFFKAGLRVGFSPIILLSLFISGFGCQENKVDLRNETLKTYLAEECEIENPSEQDVEALSVWKKDSFFEGLKYVLCPKTSKSDAKCDCPETSEAVEVAPFAPPAPIPLTFKTSGQVSVSKTIPRGEESIFVAINEKLGLTTNELNILVCGGCKISAIGIDGGILSFLADTRGAKTGDIIEFTVVRGEHDQIIVGRGLLEVVKGKGGGSARPKKAEETEEISETPLKIPQAPKSIGEKAKEVVGE